MDFDAPADSAETIERMGYAGSLKATTLDVGYPVEVVLVGPYPPEHGWFVAVHFDCDPRCPTRGTSMREDFTNLAEAETAWREAVQEYAPDNAPGM